MNSLATAWTDLQRKLAANPADWPVYVCPAGHEIALPPFSRLWDKETGHLTARPECLDCEKTRMVLQRSQRRLLADRESALLSRGVPPASPARRSQEACLTSSDTTWPPGPEARPPGPSSSTA
jgi:hypothetical protein